MSLACLAQSKESPDCDHDYAMLLRPRCIKIVSDDYGRKTALPARPSLIVSDAPDTCRCCASFDWSSAVCGRSQSRRETIWQRRWKDDRPWSHMSRTGSRSSITKGTAHCLDQTSYSWLLTSRGGVYWCHRVTRQRPTKHSVRLELSALVPQAILQTAYNHQTTFSSTQGKNA